MVGESLGLRHWYRYELVSIVIRQGRLVGIRHGCQVSIRSVRTECTEVDAVSNQDRDVIQYNDVMVLDDSTQ